MVRKKTIYVFVLAVGLVGLAMPVHAFFQSYGFFDASNKYSEWFNETTWQLDTLTYKAQLIASKKVTSMSISEKYPYPVKDLVMTKKLWQKSFEAIEAGNADWFDVEVVRQRAEMEGHPPAMDFLAWMYEGGRGLKRDYRKAFMWYERAKLSGQKKLRGSAPNIYKRLNERDRFFAKLQLKEDIERLDPPPEVVSEALQQVNLHVLDQQHSSTYKLNRKSKK